MNDKHEFQVGDLVRLKTVEEILALGFGFNERGEIAYPKSKTVLLLTSELKHCGDEFVVDDFTEIGRIDLKSPNSVERIVNICPSVLELVEVEVEDEECHEELKVKPGDKVRIKSHWELIDTGWTFDGELYYHDFDDEVIVKSMHRFLGEVCTVEDVEEGVITLEEDEDYWNWTSYMIAEVVEENTYRDEEGNPFNPNSDYIEEEEYQPYCAVVDDTPVSNNTYKPTTWDKERIQRGFENLEMYNKGYADGFQRALDLMKKEFGVE